LRCASAWESACIGARCRLWSAGEFVEDRSADRFEERAEVPPFGIICIFFVLIFVVVGVAKRRGVLGGLLGGGSRARRREIG